MLKLTLNNSIEDLSVDSFKSDGFYPSLFFDYCAKKKFVRLIFFNSSEEIHLRIRELNLQQTSLLK